jgi:hypothetical protein
MSNGQKQFYKKYSYKQVKKSLLGISLVVFHIADGLIITNLLISVFILMIVKSLDGIGVNISDVIFDGICIVQSL